MHRSIDLNKVAVFARVVEARGFTAAAKALGLPKSSVSRSVAQLEEALGVRLLQRTTRKLHLTDAGVAYYERVTRALGGLDDAAVAVSEMQGAVRGTVRITAPVDLGASLLARLVTRFVRKHPGLRIELGLTGRTVDLVAENYDLAVRAGSLADSSLVARRIGTGSSVLFASPGYVRRRGAPKTVAELAQHDAVLFRPSGETTTWSLTGPEGTEHVEVRGIVAADDFSFVRKAVLAGAGVCLMPMFLGARDVEQKRLVHLLPQRFSPGAPIHIVYPSSRHLPQRVAVFRDFLVAELPAQLGGQAG
jgi:DNA-binding transcriptional LysR family regulator